MYYQRIIINAFRYAQTHIKSNYTAASICLLNLRKGIFTTHLTKINKTTNYEKYNRKNFSQISCFVISSSFVFNFFNSKEETDDVEDLKMTIKRSILLIQKEEFMKAEQMLHIALRQAQTLQHRDAITYVYDIMANLAYDTNNFEKAQSLFVSVLQRLTSKGVAEDDLSILHISMKLADIYHKTGDLEKAEKGYRFCISNLKNHLDKDSEDQDVLQLLGATLEWYASMLFSQSRYIEALTFFDQAYKICIKVNGVEHEETIILLCNLGSVSYMLRNYDQAIEYLSRALKIGQKFPDMNDFSAVYINLGNALLAKGLYEEAKKNCNEGKKLANVKKDDEFVQEAEKCLEKIQSAMS